MTLVGSLVNEGNLPFPMLQIIDEVPFVDELTLLLQEALTIELIALELASVNFILIF